MLAPDARVVLLDQLRPPYGYRLDAAVATSFTLDLTTAIIPTLAFAAFELHSTPDPIAALEAIRLCADRFDIFCQAGQIRIPSQASDLIAYLEPMIHEVRRPRPGYLFHPKIWFLRYTSPNEADEYRLLCSTRNLTPDRSWDAIVRIDGRRAGSPNAGNRPLSSLIRHLPQLAVSPLGDDRRERIAGLAEDARHIEWDLPEDVREIAFHALGVPSERPIVDFSGYKHLIVSPFCNDEGLELLTSPASDVTLVSRVEALDRLSPEMIEGVHTFVINPLAGLADPDDTVVEASSENFSGLHAKIIVVERNRKAHVFIGSANATSAAFGGNVEFVIELMGGATKLGVDTFLADSAPFRQLLEHYDTSVDSEALPVDDDLKAVENVLRDIASHRFSLTITPASADYDARLASESALALPNGFTATVELLTRPGLAVTLSADTPVDARFAAVPLPDITPFVAVRATTPSDLTRGTVIRAELVNDPANRLDEILVRQVDTPEKFLRFLALLLGLADPGLPLDPADSDGATGTGQYLRGAGTAGILELVMRALVARPNSLIDLDRLVDRLRATENGRAILPPGFDRLWPTVMGAVARLQKANT